MDDEKPEILGEPHPDRRSKVVVNWVLSICWCIFLVVSTYVMLERIWFAPPTVQGVVTDRNGVGIVGARVILRDSGREYSLATVTGLNGSFRWAKVDTDPAAKELYVLVGLDTIASAVIDVHYRRDNFITFVRCNSIPILP